MNSLYAQTVRAGLLGIITFAALIFIPAGTLQYWQGWAFLATFTVASTALTIYMAIYDPKLLERRLRAGPRAEKEPTQKIIMFFAMLGFAASLIFPALDHRFGWSPVPQYIFLAGDVLVAISFLFIFFVVRENSYAASTIQVAEGQQVISSGPYALVRHPMYASVLLLLIGMPLSLGSWLGVLGLLAIVPILIWRLLDEEKFLSKYLPGYDAYKHKVCWRLFPGLF
jgi:protein-S-isoprenylcysteine O-methyltransferase Ste14